MPSLELRKKIEHEIVSAVIDSAIAEGYWMIADNNETETGETQDKKLLLKELFDYDYDEGFLFFYKIENGIVERVHLGFVYFMFGNEGWDVIYDYTVRLESTNILTKAQKIAEEYMNNDKE